MIFYSRSHILFWLKSIEMPLPSAARYDVLSGAKLKISYTEWALATVVKGM